MQICMLFITTERKEVTARNEAFHLKLFLVRFIELGDLDLVNIIVIERQTFRFVAITLVSLKTE